MNKIVFTDWHKVKSDDGKIDMPEKRFLYEMNKKIKSMDYNIFYDAKTTSFSITYAGEKYNVIVPSNVKVSLRSGNYNRLALELIKLAITEKKYDEEVEYQNKKDERIREIEESGYSKLVNTEDYEFYLKYLNEKSNKAKTDEEKNLIDAKIRGLLKVITNPYNLSLHLNKIICQVAQKGKTLSEERKKDLERILLNITDEYYREIVNNKDKMLILGSSTKPMHIIRQIVDVEKLLQEWLNENKEEPKKQEEDIVKYDTFSEELDEMSSELHKIIGGSKK